MRSFLSLNSDSRGLPLVLATLAAALLTVLPLHAQKGLNATDAGAEKATLLAVGMMKKGQWEEARALFQQIVAEWGNDSYYRKIPAFGTVYYNRGYCEMKLKRFTDAIVSFRTCYEDYDNKTEVGEAVSSSNVYRKTAVFQWAAAEQYQENWDE